MDDRFPLALPDNTVLAGQYIIQKVLGQGGFGITYKALDRKNGNFVAIKEFFPDSMATRTHGDTVVMPFAGDRGENYKYGKECFLQEAETLAKFIGNENIVRIYSYFEEYGTAYFVMDYIEGTSLDQYIKIHGGKLSFDEAAEILIPVMDALSAVHAKGIIHRDVSPDNIYITNDGKIKLIDFGAARQSLGDKSQSLDVVLKHGFAPKEQYTRRGKQGPFTDVYALGATFYYSLTGKRPPDSLERMDEDEIIPPSTLGVKLSKEAEEAILMALNVQPADRFQSMGAFKNAMMMIRSVDNNLENQSAVIAGPEESVPNSCKPKEDIYEDTDRVGSRPKKGKVIILASLLLVATVAFLFLYIFRNIPDLDVMSSNVKIIGNNVNNLDVSNKINVMAGGQDTVFHNGYGSISKIGDTYYAVTNTGKAVTFELTGNEKRISGLPVISEETNNLREIPELSGIDDITRLFVSEKYFFAYSEAAKCLYSVNRKNGSIKEGGYKGYQGDELTITDNGQLVFGDWDGDGSGSYKMYVSSLDSIDQVPELIYSISENIGAHGATSRSVVYGGDNVVFAYLFEENETTKLYRFDLNDDNREPQVIDTGHSLPLFDINCDGKSLFYNLGDEYIPGYLEFPRSNVVQALNPDTGETQTLYTASDEVVGITVFPDEKGKIAFFEGKEVVTIP